MGPHPSCVLNSVSCNQLFSSIISSPCYMNISEDVINVVIVTDAKFSPSFLATAPFYSTSQQIHAGHFSTLTFFTFKCFDFQGLLAQLTISDFKHNVTLTIFNNWVLCAKHYYRHKRAAIKPMSVPSQKFHFRAKKKDHKKRKIICNLRY